MNLSCTLHNSARQLSDHPAISWDGGGLSYGEFERHAARMAGALRSRHGLAPGTRVALAMENCPEFLPALYAVWRAGLSAVPINSKLHAREMAWIMADSQSRLCLATPKIADALSAAGIGAVPPILVTGTKDYAALLDGDPLAPLPGDPDDEAWMFYTSGTTGRPKGAMLTHRNLLFSSHCYYADIDYLGPGDVILHAAPLTHGSGLYALAHIARGSNNVILPGSFEPERVFEALARHANVSMFAAPTMVARLINHAGAGSADTRGLKTIIYGGAPMYAADLERALALFGPKLYHLYGQGESPMTISGLGKALHADTAHPRYQERLASVGVARTGVAIRIVDEAGRELPPGEVGEVITTSDCVMKGYWNNDRRQRPGPARRLAVDRRSRLDGCRRVRHAQGPLQGSDHLGRRQHLPARDRGGAAHACGCPGDRRGQPPTCRLGRGGDRLRRQARGRRASAPPSSISSASTTSPASSDPRATASSSRCRRTTTARS